MNELVSTNRAGKDITTSLIIASVFGKNHKEVLRDIQNLSCSKDFNERNFAPISYFDSMNREQRAYEVTKDGFSFLVMGYTGNKAGEFKEKFINEFNKRESLLKNDDYIISRAISLLSERVKTLEEQVRQKALREAMPVEPIGERLDELIKHYHLNKNRLSIRLEMKSNSLITRIVNNSKMGISLKYIQKILMTFPEISPEWLVLGTGNMLKKGAVGIRAIPLHANLKVKELQVMDQAPPDYFAIMGYAALNKIPIGLNLAADLGREAKKICQEKGSMIGSIPDPRFGRVNTYPYEVLEQVFNQTNNLTRQTSNGQRACKVVRSILCT